MVADHACEDEEKHHRLSVEIKAKAGTDVVDELSRTVMQVRDTVVGLRAIVLAAVALIPVLTWLLTKGAR